MDNSTLPGNPRALLRASEAVTNWRALAMTLLGAITVFLCVALSGWFATKSPLLGGMFGIVTIVVALAAYSAVGIILMRQAQQQSVTLGDALLQALFTVHRLFGVGLLLVLIFLGIVFLSALVLFLCRIPGIGTLLYAIAYPMLALVLGVSVVGLGLVAFPLAAPAIWEGNSVFQTVARLMTIVRRRLLSVIVNMLVLVLLVAVLSAVVSIVLTSGNVIAVGLSSAVGVQVFGGLGDILQNLAMGAMAGQRYSGFYSEGPSYAYAFALGSGLLFALGAIVPVLTAINGNCLIYLEASNGLDFDAAEGQLRAGVDEARRRAQEARERANAKLEASKAAVAANIDEVKTARAAARSCIGCQAPLGPDDRFCGECGTNNPAGSLPG